ncbi:response regulator transcription factor [Oceanirhabdus sp. W0125-5]|uniref:response regulator transcription factor n=1 Tax=Oceanirhabdus sp. W0125-5 TaxID=2999116 RepID=UPI0022F31983|nr:response regulator transcription factor [Oceanirhabdus sp. W0125-5]WBW98538.1 response regulator transcription factor [Oceanirhabdus sp. W0125-5]
MYSIYLVEDEKDLNTILSTYLRQEGWNIKSFLTGSEVLDHINDEPDLWILDIMLPDCDGFELIKKIKNKNENTPVIFISARDKDIDRVIGLEMGSDDYLAKPFLPIELIIRTKKLLKRVYSTSISQKKSETLTLGDYRIDENKRKIFFKDTEIEITSKEYDLLNFLFNNIGTAFSREQILLKIWGNDYFGSDRVVDDLIRRIRKKFSNLNLETIYGFGYRLNEV